MQSYARTHTYCIYVYICTLSYFLVCFTDRCVGQCRRRAQHNNNVSFQSRWGKKPSLSAACPSLGLWMERSSSAETKLIFTRV